ncbi:MAG: hypothetical protein ACTH34_00650 [Microbacterium gubbeenense]|uniref:hypothetical protein n=1 Tax=Microbacterium gubbeenense TaxID=159896 RepID=UPI003F98A5BC
MVSLGALPELILGSVLVAAFVAALILVLIGRGRPQTAPLLTAAILVILSLLAVVTVPVAPSLPFTIALAVLGTALAALGGDPIARRVLTLASNSMVREGPNGGILLRTPIMTTEPAPEVMRGGVTIGYLERAGAALSIIVGYPEAIAVVVAIKGIARFTELGTPEARERFIIGTLASLGWACVVAATVRIALG